MPGFLFSQAVKMDRLHVKRFLNNGFTNKVPCEMTFAAKFKA